MFEFTHESIPVAVGDTTEEMMRRAAADFAKAVAKVLERKAVANVVFAGAQSQQVFHQALREREDIPWGKIQAFGVDEFMDPSIPEELSVCAQPARDLYSHVKLKKVFIPNYAAADAEKERRRYEALVRKHPPDIACMGIGISGHVAFNEPGQTNFEDPQWVRVMNVTPESKAQLLTDPNFLALGAIPSKGITMTFTALRRAAHVLVPYEIKAAVMLRFFQAAEVLASFPATILKRMAGVRMYLDQESYRLCRDRHVSEVGRAALNLYGVHEAALQQMREAQPLDLSAPQWRAKHRGGAFTQWAKVARRHLMEALHYDPGKLDMRPEVLHRRETPEFICERIEFNTTPWFRVPGYFYTPKKVKLPAPALVVLHEWGGPILFGAERVCGDSPHPIVTELRRVHVGGRALSDWYASQGFCVITIDSFHFGRRIPRGVQGLPEIPDPATLSVERERELHLKVAEQLYYGVRQLNFVGTTWMGVSYWDDARCVDYLLARPEVDGKRIGVTGLSGGGWRTNVLAALEPRIRAAVSVGWMTTGWAQQRYNVQGAIGTFCLLPGVWNRMDVPDLIAMAAPKACMVVVGRQDLLFPPKGVDDAEAHMAEAYQWAGCAKNFRMYRPDKAHVYDADVQAQALQWFRRFLK